MEDPMDSRTMLNLCILGYVGDHMICIQIRASQDSSPKVKK